MYEIFAKLLKERGLKHADIVKATGVSSGTLTDWKMGRYVPKADKRQKIADYLGVSLEYLDTGKDSGQRARKYDNFFDSIANDYEFMEHILMLYSLPEERREPIYDLIRSQTERFRKKDAHNDTASVTA